MRTLFERMSEAQSMTDRNTPSPDDLIEAARAWTVYDDADSLITALADSLESLLADRAKLEEAVAQARVDILTTLGAVRDQMPSEAVAIFQRIAKDFEAALNRSADRG